MRALVSLILVFLAAAAAAAAAPDLPRRESGLWEIKISSAAASGGPTVHQCVDEKTDDLMKEQIASMDSCSPLAIEKEGDRIVASSVCKLEGTTATTRVVFSGQFDSVYKADIQTRYEPPLRGRSESSAEIEARWLGACKPGQKPGDVSIPGMPDLDAIMKGMPKKP